MSNPQTKSSEETGSKCLELGIVLDPELQQGKYPNTTPSLNPNHIVQICMKALEMIQAATMVGESTLTNLLTLSKSFSGFQVIPTLAPSFVRAIVEQA